MNFPDDISHDLPDEVILELNRGRHLAAELSTVQEPMRAFVEVIPQVPRLPNHSEDWNESAWQQRLNAQPVLRDPSFITGYEIRYVSHDKKYTNTEWGWDYDHVLDDDTTRIRRVYVEKQGDIALALAAWLTDFSALRDTGEFDSSLLNSPLDYYLDRPAELPHLWLSI